MSRKRLALGLDLSTQSLSAVVLDIDAGKKIASYSLDYTKDKRLSGFGIRSADYILPPRTEGEADQPPEMFLTALDAILHAGGFTEFARENGVVIVRKSGGDIKNIEVRLKDVMRNGDISKDVPLKPGDLIIVKTGLF